MATTAPHDTTIADTLAGVGRGVIAVDPTRTAAEERGDAIAWLERHAADAEIDAAAHAERHLYGRAEAFQQRATSYRAAVVALRRGDHEGMKHD